jgi:hypothetical protein
VAAGVWVDVESRGGATQAKKRKEKEGVSVLAMERKVRTLFERAKLKTETNFVTESKKMTLKCRLSLTKSQTCIEQNLQKGSNEEARSYVLLSEVL